MSNLEYADRHERKYQKPYEELREESNARHIHNALKGQLSYTTEEWLRKRGTSYEGA
jgi:hypothetical protein